MRGRKAEVQAAPNALAETPEAPDWLPEAGREEWHRVLPELIERGVVTAADLGAVETYCVTVAMIRDAQETIAREGGTVTMGSGAVKRHPAFQTLFQALGEKRRLAAELGLTPTSRNKPGARGAGKTSDFEGLLYGDLFTQR